MIKAIAVDDEPLSLNIIETFCAQLDYIDLQKTFTKPNEALRYLEKYPVDLLFLDIHMPSLNGIEFYKNITQNTLVIFCTAHGQYAVEGFNLNALDYLLKPFTLERFKQATEKAKDYFAVSSNQKSQHIFVRADYSLQKINLDDITYIEALDDYLKIYIHQQKTIVARMTMKAILEKLPASDFIRVHRSFIVPIKKVESLRNKTLQLGDKKIPVGNSYEEAVLKHFST
ncbi:MAG: DNA-binding response regulator [Bacteroidetes bacterium]|jgi:DNA-binding LytR/AlgR family response regulator|nr:DNA-binding response regulator [Bacteroidota bacterium]MDF2452406.1 DNA-binding response regulator [Bacteroidota bacterium]